MIELIDLDSSKEDDEDATVQKETSRMLTLQEFSWTFSLIGGTAGIFQKSDPC